MKTCIKCGESKHESEFPKSQHNPLGTRNECKVCKAQIGLNRKWARREEERQKALAEAKNRSDEAKIAKGIALPRNFVSTDSYVPDANFYYRNNGNKHIQSRGV